MRMTPNRQYAVQLTGPDKLELNLNKPVHAPNDYQMLCQVEATGLCYSDLKLVKQFDKHVRKFEVVAPEYQSSLKEYPAYQPYRNPTVPGHEAVVRVLEVGSKVTIAQTGKRYLVQPDLRWLKTETSNGSFGYIVEGALQEYVLVDERVFVSPEGKSMLIEAPEDKSASASALCEPWACVENAYIDPERTTLKRGGKMLVVADESIAALNSLPGIAEKPAVIDIVGAKTHIETNAEINYRLKLANLDDIYDDIICIGSDAQTVESLFGRIANKGLMVIALCGKKLERKVAIPVGRTHYGGIRICGTSGNNLAEAMAIIPQNGEIRPNDKINVVGAGGPMGVMHVIRNICQNVPGISIAAGDLDDNRINQMTKIIEPLARKRQIGYAAYNPTKGEKAGPADYTVLMAPVPQLVIDAVADSCDNGVINIFAGIPVDVNAQIDLNAYIEKKLYFIGTSGSTVYDMIAVLDKVKNNTLDTDLSVAAISGLGAAIEGIRAVENHKIAGKIIVYPQCKGLDLILLENLAEKYPQVAEKLDDGAWTLEAENTLLELFENNGESLSLPKKASKLNTVP